MACQTISSIVRGCDGNIGGITNVYINDLANVTAITEDAATWEITAMTVSSDFKAFEFLRNTSSYVEEDQRDLVAGSNFVRATITLVFSRREAAKSKAIKILGEGQRDLAVIVKDANGKYWYFPYAQLATVTEGSGTAKADGSKYNITLVAENENLAYEVDSAVIPTII